MPKELRRDNVGKAVSTTHPRRLPVSSKTSQIQKKPKRKQRPPRAVRLSQTESRLHPQPMRRPERMGVSVTINLPRIPIIRRRKLPVWLAILVIWIATFSRRVIRSVSRVFRFVPVSLRRPLTLAVALAILFVAGIHFRTYHHRPVVGANPSTVATPVRTKPDFKPLIPSAAETSAQSYDGTRNLISYDTTFSGARLIVSQQPLPANFLHDPNALRSAADSIVAKQRLETSKGPIYVATNEPGDQLAVFAGPQVLLFIHSERKLDDASWKAFIELLKIKS